MSDTVDQLVQDFFCAQHPETVERIRQAIDRGQNVATLLGVADDKKPEKEAKSEAKPAVKVEAKKR